MTPLHPTPSSAGRWASESSTVVLGRCHSKRFALLRQVHWLLCCITVTSRRGSQDNLVRGVIQLLDSNTTRLAITPTRALPHSPNGKDSQIPDEKGGCVV